MECQLYATWYSSSYLGIIKNTQQNHNSKKEVISMMGTCTGCKAENVEVNEQGLCANCAGAPAAPSTEGTDAGTETPTTPEGTM